MSRPNSIDGAYQIFYSIPGPIYIGTKTSIEALTGVQLGAFAVGYTSTPADGVTGFYDGSAWVWGGGGGGGGGAVDSVNGITGVVVLDYTDVGADPTGSAASAQAAAEAYADALVTGLWDDRGSFDASGGAYPSSGGSGTAGAILKGDVWTISVAGTLPTGQVVEVGDIVRALVDTPGNTQANWAITQNNIGYVAENAVNKAAFMAGNEASNIVYLSAKAIYDWAMGLFSQIGHTHASAGREVLSSDRTYYVRTDGSDSNDGLANTAGGAFLTIQKAIDVLSALDISTYNVTVQIADGTYVANDITLKNPVGSGNVTIQGNSGTPTNVVIDGGFVKDTPGTVYKIKDFRLTVSSSSSIDAVLSTNGAYIEITGVNFHTGYSSGSHLVAEINGTISLVGSYTISGGAQRHFFSKQMGIIRDDATLTITLTGTPAFSQQFVISATLALVRIQSVLLSGVKTTFSGSATGTRYSVTQNSVINTAGGGANYFPGNAAGSTASGGQYV